jgi:hypothetical protein
MFTQVGVGALIVAYACIGAFMFIAIETHQNNTEVNYTLIVNSERYKLANDLWEVSEKFNTLNNTAWVNETLSLLTKYQNNFTHYVHLGYDKNDVEKIWNYSSALMFCLSVFSMIGYGNLLPRTNFGKIMTMIYASFGIPLYILYFVSMGKVLASTFKWLYTWFHDCSHERRDNNNESDEGSSLQLPKTKKKIIVPSTACLWVISFYIAGGTIMFAEWEGWNYWDSVYFVVISLCKIGFGDKVPGASINSKESQTKLVINFIFILFGMGLVAMCYILMREEVREKFREIKEDAKLCIEDVSQKFAKCFGTTARDDDYEERY